MDYFVGDILVETGRTDKRKMAGILAAYDAAYPDRPKGSKKEGGKEEDDGV